MKIKSQQTEFELNPKKLISLSELKFHYNFFFNSTFMYKLQNDDVTPEVNILIIR